MVTTPGGVMRAPRPYGAMGGKGQVRGSIALSRVKTDAGDEAGLISNMEGAKFKCLLQEFASCI